MDISTMISMRLSCLIKQWSICGSTMSGGVKSITCSCVDISAFIAIPSGAHGAYNIESSCLRSRHTKSHHLLIFLSVLFCHRRWSSKARCESSLNYRQCYQKMSIWRTITDQLRTIYKGWITSAKVSTSIFSGTERGLKWVADLFSICIRS